MARKRKAGVQSFEQKDSEIAANDNSKVVINDWQDVADSEDEFHINRDKILLEEGPAQKKRRKAQEDGQEQFLDGFERTS